jgi:predicted metalloendopeptidase
LRRAPGRHAGLGAHRTPKLGKWGVDLTSLDKSVKPGDDFFLYVNGGWLKTAQIPPDRSSTGSFQDLQILSEERLKTIVADLKKTPDNRLSIEQRKLRDLYDAFVDTQAIEARGLAPVQKDLDYLAGLKTLDDVAHAMGSIKLSHHEHLQYRHRGGRQESGQLFGQSQSGRIGDAGPRLLSLQ